MQELTAICVFMVAWAITELLWQNCKRWRGQKTRSEAAKLAAPHGLDVGGHLEQKGEV